ncbi:MAG: 1-acyl-sn-glycerol-3-phosphate acyltransferase [Betaproteobacteria bacterium]|nr:MAG: 1-acyl-sn-glycerol-3-phosphate acyltransferase [Betaproteobacteria bacterium]
MDSVRFSKEKLAADGICAFARLLTGARALWKGTAPAAVQRIYYGNHTSHGDFVLIWASLPEELRVRTRPVAGADYWNATPLRRWLAHEVLRGVVIERTKTDGGADPVAQMGAALDAGDSLILFPEGTRNTTDAPLLPFRSGIWRVVAAHPDVECVPVWIENLNRVMPKGEFLPIPLLCTLSFGEPVRIAPGEAKDAFLDRLAGALLALAPPPS